MLAKLATLIDSFPGSSLDSTRWDLDAGHVTVSGNRAIIDTAVDATTTITSHLSYDALGSQIILRGTPSGTVDDSARASLQLVGTDGSLGIYLLGPVLSFRIDRAGAATDVSKPYNAAQDAYWRIRESSGQALFATSPSGVAGTWTTYRQDVHGIDLTAVFVSLSASKYVATGTGWGHGVFGHGPYGVS